MNISGVLATVLSLMTAYAAHADSHYVGKPAKEAELNGPKYKVDSKSYIVPAPTADEKVWLEANPADGIPTAYRCFKDPVGLLDLIRITSDPKAELCAGLSSIHIDGDSFGQLMIDGRASMRNRIRALRRAKYSFKLQALEITGDEVGWTVADMLLQKKKENPDFKVQIFADMVSNKHPEDHALYWYMRDNGIPVEGYDLGDNVSVYDPLLLNKRYHEKMFIVDAEKPDGTPNPEAVAFVGGMNTADSYLRAAVGRNYADKRRDQDMMLAGEIVQDIKAAFDRNWAHFQSVKMKDVLSRPTITADQVKAKLNPAVMQLIQDDAADDNKFFTGRYDNFTMWPLYGARYIQNRPRFKETYIQQTYEQLIRGSDETLLANAYFLPTKELKAAITYGLHQGHKITILTNSLLATDLRPLTHLAQHDNYRELYDLNNDPDVKAKGGKFQIYEWLGNSDATQAAEDASQTELDESKQGTLHAKFGIFGSKDPKSGEIVPHVIVMGSYNFDPRSQNLNSEDAIVVYMPTPGVDAQGKKEKTMATVLRDWYLHRDLDTVGEYGNPNPDWNHGPTAKLLTDADVAAYASQPVLLPPDFGYLTTRLIRWME